VTGTGQAPPERPADSAGPAEAVGRRFPPLLEAGLVLGLTFPLAVSLRLPTLWLLVPIVLISWTRRPLDTYGLTWRGCGTPRLHLLLIGGVFVPYAVGHCLWAHWTTGATFALRVPPDFWGLVVEQLFVVALPEETFFRGYLQTQCDLAWRRPYRLLGASCGIGLVVAAAVFAVCHVPFGGPARLAVFFPGLLYGWLRARSESIVLPTVYHAASNVLMKVMLTSLAS